VTEEKEVASPPPFPCARGEPVGGGRSVSSGDGGRRERKRGILYAQGRESGGKGRG